jgi:hypothetical protein
MRTGSYISAVKNRRLDLTSIPPKAQITTQATLFWQLKLKSIVWLGFVTFLKSKKQRKLDTMKIANSISKFRLRAFLATWCSATRSNRQERDWHRQLSDSFYRNKNSRRLLSSLKRAVAGRLLLKRMRYLRGDLQSSKCLALWRKLTKAPFNPMFVRSKKTKQNAFPGN